MTIDIPRLQERGRALQVLLDALTARASDARSADARAHLDHICDLAAATIEAIDFLAKGGSSEDLSTRVTILHSYKGSMRAALPSDDQGAPVTAVLRTIYELADDTIEALEFQADVSAEVERAAKGSEPEAG